MLILNSTIDTQPIKGNHKQLFFLTLFFSELIEFIGIYLYKIFMVSLSAVFMYYNYSIMKKCDAKVLQYLAYRELNTHFLSLLGWSTTYSSLVYRMVPYVHLFLGITLTFVIFGFVKAHYTNIFLLIKGFSVMTSSTIVALKITCLIIHRKEVYEITELLDGHIVQLLERNHLSHFILNEIARYRFLSWGIFISVFFCNMIFNIMSLSKIISNHLHHVQPDHYIFPYPSLFPWPVPLTGLLFRLHFLFESLASLSVIVVTVGVDSIFTFFVFLMIGQLREISYSITHIDKNSDRNNVAKECVRQYCIVLKCRDNLQKIYGPIILCLMTTNAVVLCLTIYQMTQIQSFSPLKILLFFTYISLKLIQTYMYSWCGTHLTAESEECRNAIYASNWYGDKRFMTAITIMLQQKPLILTACNFTTVSIDMFTKILNTTISYYFLLKTLE